MLFVALPKWQWKMKLIIPSSSLNTPPYPIIPRLPIGAPSILHFRYPFGGGCQKSFPYPNFLLFY